MALLTTSYSARAQEFSKSAHAYIREEKTRQPLEDLTPPPPFIPTQDALQDKITQEWNEYVGNQWKDVLVQGGVNSSSRIIEVAPGEKSKIGEGIVRIGTATREAFKGQLTIIEPERSALDSVTQIYSDLLPNARIIPVQKTLDQFIQNHEELESPKVDALIANHGIDDMIIGKSLGNSEFENLFQNHYSSEAEKTATPWKALVESPQKLEKIEASVVQEWHQATEEFSPHLLTLSAYRSCFFEDNSKAFPSLIDADIEALKTLSNIRQDLYQKGKYKILIPETPVLTANQNWVVMTR